MYRLYQAAFDRAPDSIGIGFWIHRLDQGMTLHDVAGAFVASDVADVLAAFSDSPENQAALIGTIYNGIAYTPYTGA